MLWVGTGHGLSCFNRYQGRFRTIPFLRARDTISDIIVHRLLTVDDRQFMAATTRYLRVRYRRYAASLPGHSRSGHAGFGQRGDISRKQGPDLGPRRQQRLSAEPGERLLLLARR